MSEPELTADFDVTPPAEPAEPVAPPVDQAVPPPDPIEEESDVTVPVGVAKALREELKQAKAQAAEAARLRAELDSARPYVEFLQQNKHLLEQRPPAPAPPPDPKTDPALIEYARTLDLYTAEGQPDVARAQKLREMTRAEAEAVARATLAPVAAQTYEQRAAANLSQVMEVTKANGTPLEEQYLIQAVQSVTGRVPREKAVEILSDPAAVNLLALTALGLQAASKKAPAAPTAPVAQPGPVLDVERPGGPGQIQMSEDSRRLMRIAGVSEKQYVESAKRYVPGKSNSLE